MENQTTIDVQVGGIKVYQQVHKGIYIDTLIDLTPKEYQYMMEMVAPNSSEARLSIVSQYYFGMKMSLRDVAKTLEISKSTVEYYVNKHKSAVLKNIKQDLRANKKVLEQMVSLITECENSTRSMWRKYSQLETESNDIRKQIQGLHHSETAENRIGTASAVANLTDKWLKMHSTQQGWMHLIQNNTQKLLNVFDKFGLTGNDAMEIILKGGIDIDVKVEQIRKHLLTITKIVKEEVAEKDKQRNIFKRIAREIGNDFT